MKQLLKKFSTLMILLVLFVLFSVSSENFLKVNNILNILRQISVLGILTCGMTFVIISGGMDLTVGAYLGLTGVIAAKFMGEAGMPIPVALLLTVLLITLIGCVTGCLIGHDDGCAWTGIYYIRRPTGI